MKLKISKLLLIVLVSIFSLNSVLVNAESGSRIEKVNAQNDRAEKMKELNDNRKSDLRDARASSTMLIREIKSEYKDERKDIQASTSSMFKRMKDDNKNIAKKMQLKAFETRKNALVKELVKTLETLGNIRNRLSDRIIKAEASGRNMTEAKAALVIADSKIAIAKDAVNALKLVGPVTSTSTTSVASTTGTTASSTPEVDLSKPRQIGDAAIKAVKDARDALKKVTDAIAKNMGFGNTTATSTTSTSGTTVGTTTTATTTTTTATTTNTTATSTATTTAN